MKRLLLAVVFALLPVALIGQVPDRDVLVTPNGTLYTIESVINDGSVRADASQFLRLTIERGSKKSETLVPDSLTAGRHWRPALAYDSDSDTLFVFWIKMPNLSSELMLASYSDGTWHPAASVDPQQIHLRSNLRVGITRKIATLQDDQSYADVPMLLIHAIWWEETGFNDAARYALFAVANGKISLIELHKLDDFAPSASILANNIDPNFNPEILKHPAFADNGTQNSIDVIYGDTNNNDFVRVRVKPIQAEVRIHIPIGAHPGGPRVVAPKSFTEPWSGAIGTITSPHDGSMLLYNTAKDAVSYIMYSGRSWSSVKSVPLSDRVSADAAVAALTRMMSQ